MWQIILLVLIYFGSFVSSQVIDLTHDFDPHIGTTAYWQMVDAFNYTSSTKVQTDDYYYESNSFCASEHGGTHIDAPSHFAKGKMSVEEILPKQLITSPFFIDISEEAANNPDLQVSVKQLEDAESKQGRIPDNAILMIYSGNFYFYFFIHRVKIV